MKKYFVVLPLILAMVGCVSSPKTPVLSHPMPPMPTIPIMPMAKKKPAAPSFKVERVQSPQLRISATVLPQCVGSTYTLTLDWSYDFLNNPTVDAFKLYSGTTSDAYTNITVIDGQTTSISISNLLIGTVYFFNMTALDTVDGTESSFSGEISYVMPVVPDNIFKLNLIVNAGVPTIQTQVCPFQVVNIQYSIDLHNWIPIQSIVADQYGNIAWNDVSATDARFYRGQTQ